MAGRLDESRAAGTPTYYEAFAEIQTGVRYFWNLDVSKPIWTPSHFLEELRAYCYITPGDCATVLALALLWTALRHWADCLILRPFSTWAQLMPQDAQKFPESAFKCLAYVFTWAWTCYAIFAYDEYNHIFHDHLQLFSDWKEGMSIAPIIYWMYMTQMALYVHSAYATLFMDTWRKDTVVLLIHHTLTMGLIGFSYAIRYHKIGMLVLFLHDVTDIILEFTKCQVYLKKRGGKLHKLNDVLATAGFLAFTTTWIVFRLYWLPVKALHSAAYGGMLLHARSGKCPFYFFFNGMLWMLQLLHVYWFMFILNLLYKVATGQMKEVDDVREEDVIQRVNEQIGLLSNVPGSASERNNEGSSSPPAGKSKNGLHSNSINVNCDAADWYGVVGQAASTAIAAAKQSKKRE